MKPGFVYVVKRPGCKPSPAVLLDTHDKLCYVVPFSVDNYTSTGVKVRNHALTGDTVVESYAQPTRIMYTHIQNVDKCIGSVEPQDLINIKEQLGNILAF